MTASNGDLISELIETEWSDGTVICSACQASGRHDVIFFGEEGIIDADNPQHIIGAMLRCWNCRRVITSRYTREYQALIDEEQAQVERDRKAIDEDYRRQSARRLATGGYY